MRILVLVLVLFGFAPAAVAAHLIGAEEAREAALKGELVVIVIRTPGEWAQSGVADVAHTIDMRSEAFIPRLIALRQANPGKPLAIICATGGRSTYVTTALEERGLHIQNIPEGMFGSRAGPGWLSRKLPVRAPGAARTE